MYVTFGRLWYVTVTDTDFMNIFYIVHLKWIADSHANKTGFPNLSINGIVSNPLMSV